MRSQLATAHSKARSVRVRAGPGDDKTTTRVVARVKGMKCSECSEKVTAALQVCQ